MEKCFCRLADGCFDLSAVDSDPIGGLKVRRTRRPAVPRCQPNHIIITGGYFIVGDNIWSKFFLKFDICFCFFTSAFYLIVERRNKKNQFFGYYFNLNFVRHPMSRSRTKSISPDNSKIKQKIICIVFFLFRIECLDWIAASLFFIPTNPTRVGISHVHSTSVSPGPVRVCIFDERKERGRRKRREEGVQRTRSYIRRKWGGGGKEKNKKKQNKQKI